MIEEQSTQARVDALLAEALPKIGEIASASVARIREAASSADERIGRFESARAELEEVEAEIESMRAEREELPNRAYRAGLDGEYRFEDELKERYQNLKPAIEASEGRAAGLREELYGLLPGRGPRHDPHPLDHKIHHTAKTAGLAHGELKALERLRHEIVEAVDAAAGQVREEHDRHRGPVNGWVQAREWERSPARGYRPPSEEGAA